MAITIDTEAKKLLKLIVDVDRNRRKYKKTENDVTVTFVSPKIVSYELNRMYLLRNCRYSSLKKDFYYRPDYLSYQEYGTTLLWPLLLFVNDIVSIDEFIGPKVLVPTRSAIMKLSRFADQYSTPIDLDLLNYEPNYQQIIKLYTSNVVPPLESQSDEATVSGVDMPSFLRQKISVNDTIAANQFIDLAYLPIVETVELRIFGQNLVLVYDEHYTMINDSSGQLKRLSWKGSDNILGPGLDDVIISGMILEVKYAKEE